MLLLLVGGVRVRSLGRHVRSHAPVLSTKMSSSGAAEPFVRSPACARKSWVASQSPVVRYSSSRPSPMYL
jgi:hypothetical protein